MPNQYKHKEWERYFPMVPLVTWIKSQNLRKLKSWTYTGIVWTVLLGTTTLYLTDWNPIAKYLPSKKESTPNTDHIDPSDNSLYQKVAYGCGFYKFIKRRCNQPVDDYKPKKTIDVPDDVENRVGAAERKLDDNQKKSSNLKAVSIQMEAIVDKELLNEGITRPTNPVINDDDDDKSTDNDEPGDKVEQKTTEK